MLKATLIGKEETFRFLGIENNQEIELDALLVTLQKQFEGTQRTWDRKFWKD